MCTFNEIGFLRLSKGVWNWTNSEGVFFSADIFKGQMIRVFKVAWKVFAINLGYQRAVFYHESRGNLFWKCNLQAWLYTELVYLKKIVRRNLVKKAYFLPLVVGGYFLEEDEELARPCICKEKHKSISIEIAHSWEGNV